jgi:hypothetical protein
MHTKYSYDFNSIDNALKEIRTKEPNSIHYIDWIGEALHIHLIPLGAYYGKLKPLVGATQKKKVELNMSHEEEQQISELFYTIETYMDVLKSYKYLYSDKAKMLERNHLN